MNAGVLTKAVCAVLLVGSIGCEKIAQSQEKSTDLVIHLHEQMNADEAAAICANADEAFKNSGTAEDCIELFTAVHRKLGDAGSTAALATQIVASTKGTFIKTTFDTNYSNDMSVKEYVVWHESGGVYRLYGYNVNSKALLK
jgi:hypothetical protein